MSPLEAKVLGTPVNSVFNMNKVFGNEPVMFSNANWRERVINQMLNIGDEIEELREAVIEKDKKEIADAVGDIFTFAYGADYFFSGLLFTSECMNYPVGDISDIDVNTEDYLEEIDAITEIYQDLLSIFDEIKSLRNVSFEEFYHYIRPLRETLCDLLDDVGNNFVFFDFEELMNEVTISNLTKVCLSVEERDDTMSHYVDLGINVYSHDEPKVFEGVEYYVVYSSDDQEDKNGKVYRKDKFLKNVKRFREPDIQGLVSE